MHGFIPEILPEISVVIPEISVVMHGFIPEIIPEISAVIPEISVVMHGFIPEIIPEISVVIPEISVVTHGFENIFDDVCPELGNCTAQLSGNERQYRLPTQVSFSRASATSLECSVYSPYL